MSSLYFIAVKGSKAKTPFYRLWTETRSFDDVATTANAYMRKQDAQRHIDRQGMNKYWEVVSVKFEPK